VKFSASLEAKLYVGFVKILDVQERYRPPIITPSMVRLGLCARPGRTKKFGVFVCLSVKLLNGIELVQTSSPLRRLNMEMVLISLDSGRFVGLVMHPR